MNIPYPGQILSLVQRMNQSLQTIGWRERLALPELGIGRITCKVDTGARSSSLHALNMETFVEQGRRLVRFDVQPNRKKSDFLLHCQAEVLDERVVSNSGGARERRIVILTPVEIGSQRYPIEVTLTNREAMRYRMLLGRTGLSGRFMVDTSKSYLMGKNRT